MAGKETRQLACAVSLTGLLLVWTSPAAGQSQRYELSVPGEPSLSSVAEFTDEGLLVTDAQGQVYRYLREPRFDSADRKYVGYHSPQSEQSLRWPASGTGSMYVGDARGAAWRESRQQILPLIAPGIPPRSAAAPPAPGLWAGLDAPHIALGKDRRGREVLARIESAERVQLLERSGPGWTAGGTIATHGLVPGAPLVVGPAIEPHGVRIYTVSARGQLVAVSADGHLAPLASPLTFAPQTHLASQHSPQGLHLFAVDLHGFLQSVQTGTGVFQKIEAQPGMFLPGSPLTAEVTRAANGVARTDVYLTDRRGVIVRYRREGHRWSNRDPVAEGFVPGGPVAVGSLGNPSNEDHRLLAAVDTSARLQLIQPRGTSVVARHLQPASHVSMLSGVGGPAITAIDRSGEWRVWRLANQWQPELIGPGFLPGAPVLTDPVQGQLLSVDRLGRLVPAAFTAGHWQCHLCGPMLPHPARLISRTVQPAKPLAPARVHLVNRGQEELAVQVVDAAGATLASSRTELRIPAGQTATVDVVRESAAMVEEVYETMTPDGRRIREVETYAIPPAPRYTLVVWANRVVYQYIDNRPDRPQGALPDFDLSSFVSLGVFDLPPGELIRDGQTIDLLREVSARRNPGEATWFVR